MPSVPKPEDHMRETLPTTRQELGLAVLQTIHPLATGVDRLREGKAAGRLPVGPAIHAALNILQRVEVAGVPFLTGVLLLDRQSVQRVVNQLVGDGLVERLPNAAHARSPFFKLTDRGAQELELVREEEWSRLKPMLAPFTREELATCYSLLQHLRIELAVVER